VDLLEDGGTLGGQAEGRNGGQGDRGDEERAATEWRDDRGQAD
jgi:hypothetical protein